MVTVTGWGVVPRFRIIFWGERNVYGCFSGWNTVDIG